MDQDWNEVVIRKKAPAKPASNDEALRLAQQGGYGVETVKKYNAGTNKNKAGPGNARKLEEETEELAHKKVSHTLAQRMQKARMDAKLTQKELATRINEKPSIINDYEAGRAIPNNQIILKIEKALSCKLR